MYSLHVLAAAGVTAVLAQLDFARAEDRSAPPVDKSVYSLFNPVPDDKLRDFSPDRPGKSHSTITVDAGRFQIESDILNYTRDGPSMLRSYTLGAPLLKVGVTNWMDFQIGTSLFNHLRQGSGASAINASGFGDTVLGAKINLFGNDGGDQSMALVPFVKLPTAARDIGNGHAEFTLNVPYTIALSKPWSLTLEPNFGILRNDANTSYRQNYGFIANLSRPVFFETLTAAIEVAVDVSSEGRAQTRVSLDPSLQWLVTKNLQLDIGIYLGLNKATPQYNPYLGVAYRY
jgi:hypothetical protein